MKFNSILSNLELIANSSGNIQRLRKLIIVLAINGRLGESSDHAFSIPDILSEIVSTRLALIKAGKAKKQRLLPPISQTELPIPGLTPRRFARLEVVANLEKGMTAIQRAKPGGFPLITTGENKSSCDHYDFEGCATLVPMVSSTGHGSASLKRLHYQEGQFAVGNILCAVFPICEELLSARFIFEYLSAFKEELLVSKMIGTANVSLTIGKIGEVPIPIVPRTVQQKVDELMALCDRLGESLAIREELRDRLVVASLHSFNSSLEREIVSATESFYFTNLSRLTSRTEHIKQLRETILNAAVQGRLSTRESGDQPVSGLLDFIHKEQKRLFAAGVIPKPKTYPLAVNVKAVSKAPAGWQIVPLGRICNLVTSGSRGWAEYYSESGPKFIRAQNVRFGKLRLDELACVNPPKKSEGTRTSVSKNDLLVVITGAGVTNPAIMDTDLGEAYVSQHVGLIKLTDTKLSPWLLLCLMAPRGGRDELVKRAYGAGKPGLNLDNIRSLPIPLPPLTEQNRIVERVGELMNLCDGLESCLEKEQERRNQLLESLLHGALLDISSNSMASASS